MTRRAIQLRTRHRLVPALVATLMVFAAACTQTSTESSAPAQSTASNAESATAAPSGSADGAIGGTVSVIAAWGGAEQESFLAMVAPFEEQTGITVEYTGTRDLNAVLTTGVASGILPDVAALPGPGQLIEYANQGALQPLDDVLDTERYEGETAPALRALGSVDEATYGVFVKAAVKGLVWYNPAVYDGSVPASWDELQASADATAAEIGGEARPWCVGLEFGAASGWPGTDWVEDFVLRQSGPDVFDSWVAGEQAWTSPEISAAFEAYLEVVASDSVYGGPDTVLTLAAGDGGNALFTDPPGCIFHHQASFITDFFKNQGGASDGDFDFFPFPDIEPEHAGAVLGAGDLLGMFNDTPQARALIAYLVTAEAQAIWVGRGGALSANTAVTDYPDEFSRRSAEILADAAIFRFDGSDLMPQEMNAAFWAAILEVTQSPDALDEVLANLDTVQETAYGGG